MLDLMLLGEGPRLRSWHPRYPDHDLVLRILTPILERKDKRLLLLGNSPTVFSAIMADGGERFLRLQTNMLLRHPPEYYAAVAGAFDACLIELDEVDIDKCADLIDRVAPLIKRRSPVLVSIFNRRSGSKGRSFTRMVGLELARMLRPSVTSSQHYFMKAGALRRLSFSLIARLAQLARARTIVVVPVIAVAALPVALMAWIGNLFAGAAKTTAPRGVVSSFLMKMEVDHGGAIDAYIYSPEYVRRDRNRLRGRRVDDEIGREAGFKPANHLAPIVGSPPPSERQANRSVNFFTS